MNNATDQQAAQEILDANPGMLWQRAQSVRDGSTVFARVSGDASFEVVLTAPNGDVAVTVWERIHFIRRFELVGTVNPLTSAELDQTLFAAQVSGLLETIEVA